MTIPTGERRSVLGWIALVAFIGWNLFILATLLGGLPGNIAAYRQAGSEVDRHANLTGGAFALMLIGFVWLFGAIVLGLFAYLTRARRR